MYAVPVPLLRPGRRRWTLLAAVVVAGAASGPAVRDHVRGASLVIHAAGLTGWPARITSWQQTDFTETTLDIPTRQGPVRARLYRPARFSGRTIVLVAGVHADGIDEPRLVGFARHLAAEGEAVVTPRLADLEQYRLTAGTTDTIEDAAVWVSAQPDLAPDGRVGMMGISFGGGLTLVAAGRPTLTDKAAFAFSFGGYGDLPRVLRFLCTGRLPDGGFLAPHDYGVVIILLGAADRLVPPDQVDGLRRGLLTFLSASHLDMVDKPRAAVEFDRARAMERDLPEPAATYLHWVNTRDVAALGPKLLPVVDGYGADPALSAERSPPTHAHVYLLHGTGDTVIPAYESLSLEAYLAPHTRLRLLISPLITHAEVDRPPSASEVWHLVRFWTRVLDE